MRYIFRVRFYAVRSIPRATPLPFVVPPSRGIGVLVRHPVPPLSTGPEFVEVAAGPGAWRGCRGKCAGANVGLLSISRAGNKATAGSAVCQLLDRFDKDLMGVSALQQSAVPHTRVR